MDLNMSHVILCRQGQFENPFSKSGCANNHGFDTTLRLDSLGPRVRKNINTVNSRCGDDDDSCMLVLGLGPAKHPYCDKVHTEKIGESTSIINQQPLPPMNDSELLELGLFTRIEDDCSVYNNSIRVQNNSENSDHQNSLSMEKSTSNAFVPTVDEGSTSAKRSGGYMPSLILAPRMEKSSSLPNIQELLEPRSRRSYLQVVRSASIDCSIETLSESISSGAKGHHPKKCQFSGCLKGARGTSRFCIAHGGGQRCQKPGCTRGAETRTVYCKAHGGGRRCQHLGCTKSAEGKTDLCIAHGGGRRCGQPGCTKAARGKSGLCIRHGGGKRCKIEGCTRSAEGQAGLCISHGGGRRCQYPSCTKGSQGSTMFCKAHGGGKRCVFAGCTKGAEGSTPLCKAHGGGKRCLFDGGGVCPKSVHGGTNYCVAHGGGKRCIVLGCTKSARGRTDCCVRHGGGKRCQVENCGKSAQGCTDFCKAHGGGKRCIWGNGKCEKFARGKSGLCAAHGNVARDADRMQGSMIEPTIFKPSLPSVSSIGSGLDHDYSSSTSAISECVYSPEKVERIRQLVPPQVLVPSSMKTSGSMGSLSVDKGKESCGKRNLNLSFDIPEGRVHGGGLLSLLGGDMRNAAIGGI